MLAGKLNGERNCYQCTVQNLFFLKNCKEFITWRILIDLPWVTLSLRTLLLSSSRPWWMRLERWASQVFGFCATKLMAGWKCWGRWEEEGWIMGLPEELTSTLVLLIQAEGLLKDGEDDEVFEESMAKLFRYLCWRYLEGIPDLILPGNRLRWWDERQGLVGGVTEWVWDDIQVSNRRGRWGRELISWSWLDTDGLSWFFVKWLRLASLPGLVPALDNDNPENFGAWNLVHQAFYLTLKLFEMPHETFDSFNLDRTARRQSALTWCVGYTPLDRWTSSGLHNCTWSPFSEVGLLKRGNPLPEASCRQIFGASAYDL